MIEVRRIKSDQIEPIRNWRNSQRNILRQNHIISKKEQENYFKKEVWPQDTLLDPRQILRSICIDKKLVGYGGLTNIDWPNKRAELSFLLKNEIEEGTQLYSDIMSEFIQIFVDKCARNRLHRLFTETYEFREKHIEVLEKNKFVREGRLRDHIYKDKIFYNSIIHGRIISEK